MSTYKLATWYTWRCMFWTAGQGAELDYDLIYYLCFAARQLAMQQRLLRLFVDVTNLHLYYRERPAAYTPVVLE